MPQGKMPAGTVTFLFTDIEGSTKLWESFPEAMRAALARHDALMREAIGASNGYVFKTIGDAFCAAFSTAGEALEAVLAAQLALHSEPWPEAAPIKVRMALHTGAVESRDDDYFGPPVNRVARLLSTAHGGQSVLSQTTYDLVRDFLPDNTDLKNLGSHQLKDLARPEQVYQLLHPLLPSEFPPIRSLSTRPNNLPQQLTSFIGRDKEAEQLKSLLTNSRLVTLTGSGGTGKTRLSLQVAANTLDQYPDGAWFVDLAPLTEPELVASTTAKMFGLKEEQGKPLVQSLTGYLQTKQLLLLLDNCEHLLGACAQLADAILRNCPEVHILATSREAMAIQGEATYRVPSLSLPSRTEQVTPEILTQYEAVNLFIERALAHQPQFSVTNQNAPALASVCQKLDGIPLAIELAAARVRSMSIEDINVRLDHRFRLLTGGSRTALPRQQTLRALVDWSYDLLNEAERALLCRLSVFLGGWTLGAAEKVCAGDPVEDWDVLDLLTSLCDKSLVVAEEHEGAMRYRLLETVRQYASDRLGEAGDAATWRRSHLEFFMELAGTAKAHINFSTGGEVRKRLEDDTENLRAALEFACETDGDAACIMVVDLFEHWRNQAPSEGRVWASRALAMPCNDARKRCHALIASGHLALVQGDFQSALPPIEEALQMARDLDDPELVALARFTLAGQQLNARQPEAAAENYTAVLEYYRQVGNKRNVAAAMGNLGNAYHERGEVAEAIRLWEESLAINREIGHLQGVAAFLGNIGNAKYDAGDYPAARKCKQEALGVCREYGWVWGAAGCLVTLADVDILEGDLDQGRAKVTEALQIFQRAGIPPGIADALQVFAKLAVAESAFRKAAMLYGAASAIFDGLGSNAVGDHGHEQEAGMTRSRAALGDEAYAAAYAEGRAIPPERAIDLAMTTTDG